MTTTTNPSFSNPAGAGAGNKHLDPTALLSLQEPLHVRLSPSGTHVVYASTLHMHHRTGTHPVSTLFLARVGVPSSARQLTSGLFNDTDPSWAPDGESIIFISDRANAGKSSAVYQLFLSLSGAGGATGEAFPLTNTENERAISTAEWSPDGKFIAFLSADEKTKEKKAADEEGDDAIVYGKDWEFARLRVVSVGTRKVEVLMGGKEQHIADFSWGPKDGAQGKIVFVAQETPEIESPWEGGSTLGIVDLRTEKVETLIEVNSPMNMLTWVAGKVYWVGGFLPGTKNTANVLWSISVDQEEAEVGKRKCEVCAGGKEDCVLDVLSTADGEVFVKIATGLDTAIRKLDGKTVIHEEGDMGDWDVVKSEDGELAFAVVKSTMNHPAEVFSYAGKEGLYNQLSALGDALGFKPAWDVTRLFTKSSDEKVVLDGFFVAPEKDKKKAWPTVVIVHGGPYWRSTAGFRPMYSFGWGPYLLSAGYAVMYPNYRGGLGHGEEFATYVKRAVGSVEYDDVVTLTQHCIGEGLIDKSNMIVSGWSQGGYLSYLSAVRNGTHKHGWTWKGAICGAGVTCWDSMAMTSDVPGFESELAGVSPWATQKSDLKARANSPIWEMAEAGKAGRIPPILILHGEKDERVPINQAWAFHRGCKEWKVPCEMVTYPREPHALKERKHHLDMFVRMRKFCDLHLS